MAESSRVVSLALHGLAGWAICGATIGIGRQVVSMQTTLLVHAVVAPLAFGFLTWHHARRFQGASPRGVAFTMTGMIIALDALVVAPFLERSFVMFRSVLGTWVPFASIAAASYVAVRLAGSAHHTPRDRDAGAAEPRVAGR